MKGFHYSTSQLCDSFSLVASQGQLAVVELVGRQLQKVVQGLSQETQRGNETTTPNAQMLYQLETKERIILRNDPQRETPCLHSLLCAQRQHKLPTGEEQCTLRLCSERPVELSL